jgi:hypothetical protein
MKDLVRHGDMLFRRSERGEYLNNLKQNESRIIQRGEATGHAHRITEGEAAILERYEEQWTREARGRVPVLTARFLDVQTPTTITHEEHKPVVLNPGLWEILQAREFDYARDVERRVRD